MKPYKIAVGLITVDYKVHWAMVASFLKMLSRDFSGYEFTPIFQQGIYIDELRNRVCTKFLETDCEFLFFLDYDNGLQADWLDCFMEDFEDPEVNIVSGIYEFKTDKCDYVAGVQRPYMPAGTYEWVNRVSFTKPLINLSKDYGSVGGMVGAGCLMIRKSALEKMHYPYFESKFVRVPDGMLFWGEDTGFCANAEQDGLSIHLDQRIKSPHMAGDTCYPPEWRQFEKSSSGGGKPFPKGVRLEDK
jgi:hypothetical protein